jgi:arylsulfatase
MPCNIVLLFPDQWRGDWLSHLGHGIPTPYTDQLAAEGVSFRRAYSPSPTCTPARAVLATGRSPWNCGRLGYRDHLPWPYHDTLQHRLTAAGYQTMQVGKTHYHPMRLHLGFEINRSYEASLREPGYQSHYHTWLAQETGGRVRDTALDRNPNAWPVQPWEAEERLHCTRWTADEAISCLEHRDPTRPFFLQVGFHRPHVPFDPPRRCWEALADHDLGDATIGSWAADSAPLLAAGQSRGQLSPPHLRQLRRAYAASIAFVDEQFGRIDFALRRLGLARDTCIILASDHGELAGDHNRLFKATFQEGSARIPLVIRPPAFVSATRGQVRDEIVDLADILPTCCALADCPATDVDGWDLGPLLRNEAVTWRHTWHGEHWNGTEDFECVINGDWKYIVNLRNGEEWLFDLASDPGETTNLAAHDAQHPQRNALRADLIHRLTPRDGFVADGDLVIGVERPLWRADVLGTTVCQAADKHQPARRETK